MVADKQKIVTQIDTSHQLHQDNNYYYAGFKRFKQIESDLSPQS